jgi:hypothetical protein
MACIGAEKFEATATLTSAAAAAAADATPSTKPNHLNMPMRSVNLFILAGLVRYTIFE